ncbi:MAG: PorT family protein [Bacteroidales bacterium]|nr:PorT family protein [Bacteroidales bacterium]
MRILVCFLCFAFCLCQAAKPKSYLSSASGAGKLNLYVGFHGGANASIPIVKKNYSITSLSGAEEPTTKYNPFYQNLGYQFGISLAIGLGNNLMLMVEPGIWYTKAGYTISQPLLGSISGVEWETSIRTVYYNFPVGMLYKPGNGSYRTVFLAGVTPGLLNRSDVAQTERVTRNINGEESIADGRAGNTQNLALKPFSLGAYAGVGYLLELANVMLIPNVKFNYNILKATNENSRFSTGNSYVQNDFSLHQFMLGVAVLFSSSGNSGVGGKGALDCTYDTRKKR